MTWNMINWADFCEKMRRKDGSFHPILNCGPSVDGRHWVAISSPELVKKVLTAVEPDEERPSLYPRLRITSPTFADAYTAWIGEGLLSSQGSKWHIHRKACVPLFFSSILHKQLDSIAQSTHELIRSIRMAERANLFQSFIDPQKRLNSHVMRCLLHLIAGSDIVHEAKVSTARHSIDWMITQQHKLIQHFRSSLEKTSFLGGRVWNILGNRVSSMLPWVGGEGNLHALQKERYSLACYFQSLLNRLRYEESDDEDPYPTQNDDLLSMLFHLKLDEDFDIQHNLPQTRFKVQPIPTPPTTSSNPHAPTPPLPSRRSFLKRSMSNLGRKGSGALVITPPHSPSSSDSQLTPVVPPHLLGDPDASSSESGDTSPEFVRLPPAPYQEPSKSKFRNFKITNAHETSLNSSSEEVTEDEETELEATPSSPEQFSPLPQFAASQSDKNDDEQHDDDASNISGWETSSDGSAREIDDPGSTSIDPEGLKTDQNWSTMPYNSNGSPEPLLEEDPECVPGSQPIRPGHLPDETIIDQALSFLAAGYQPVATSLEWCLYHIAKDKNIYSKLQQESHLVLDGRIPHVTCQYELSQQSTVQSDDASNMTQLPDGSGLGLGDVLVSASQLSQLRYTRNFVKEVLRFHPTQPVIESITNEDVKWGDKKLPEGTAIGLMVWNLHRDPHFWKQPEHFWPERFDLTAEGSTTSVGGPTHAYAYLPFSSGSHSCIGQKYAMQHLIISVALLVRAFEMELSPHEQVKEVFFDGLLSPSSLRIRFIPRDFETKAKPSRSQPGASQTRLIQPTHLQSRDLFSPAAPILASSSDPSTTPTLSRRSKGSQINQ